jgi:hypothetical protein
MAEFLALSAKVSARSATDEERERWRQLRAQLVAPPPSAPPGKTPRRHARTSRKLRLRYTTVSDMLLTFTDEIGGGGLRMKTPRHIPHGEVVVVRIDFGGEKDPPLTVVARTAWSKRERGHFVIGLEFVDLSAADRERIEAYAHASKGT